MTPAAPPSALQVTLQRLLDMDAPIATKLEHYASELRRELPHFAEAVDRLVERLGRTGAGRSAPDVGDTLPPFLLPDDEGRLVSFEELLADGPIIVAFHRGHWCPYCRINSRGLAEVDDRVRALGGRIVAITPELQHFTAEHKSRAGARFHFLSDIENGYALSLGLAIWVGAEMEAVMREIGRDLPRYQGNTSWFLPIPATFVVARDGVIRARFIDPDYRHRVDIEVLVAALAAAA